MKIQKGLVKYKDRSDIVCTYAITDDGKQFYFLNDSKLSNDNIIVTTSLVEAIDPSVVCANVGVINASGNVVIECNHKAIKLITKDILLVENSNPTSPSVIESVKLRKDPLAATNLVSTPAVIKDKIFGMMGNDGRFLFNDQFSEASLFDLNGKNLLENKYYSFISINKAGDTLYLCGNTKESAIDTYSLVTMKFNDSTAVPETAPVPPATEETVDVSKVEVDKTEIDNAMNGEEIPAPEVPSDVAAAPVMPAAPVEAPVETVAPAVEEATPESAEVPAEAPVESVEAPTEEVVEVPPVAEDPTADVPAVDVPAPEVPMGVDIVPPVEEEIPTNEEVAPTGDSIEEAINATEVVPPAIPAEEEVPETEESTTNDIQSILDIVTNNNAVDEELPANVEEVPTTHTEDLPVSVEDTPNAQEEVSTNVEENVIEEKEEEPFNNLEDFTNNEAPSRIDDTPNNDFDNFLTNSNFDYGNNNYQPTYSENNILDDIEEESLFDNRITDNRRYSGNESIMNDAANTLSKLIDVNKNQQSQINSYKDQVKELTSLNKKVVDKARHDRDRMKNSISNYESEIDRLKAQMESLQDRIHEKERIISNQSSELSNLRVQVEGKNNLQKILQDAESLLGNNKY